MNSNCGDLLARTEGEGADVLDVEHPPRLIGRGFRGGVNEERPHDENSAARDKAGHGLTLFRKGRDPRIPKYTKTMRSRDHSQRAVVRGGRIEMNAQRHDPVERFGRRLSMQDAGLDRPGTPASCLEPSFHRQRLVLMPGDEPVRSRGLLEERGTKRIRRSRKGLGCQADQACIESRRANCRNREYVSCPGSTSSDQRLGKGF